MYEDEHPLSDGRAILIRRLTPADSTALAEAFSRLSDESRRLRFHAPKPRLSDAELRYLTDVDGRDHEALVAIDPVTRDGVGSARFFRDGEDPSRAEVAVTVVDDWQHRGVATALLTQLSAHARQEGITRFTALTTSENRTAQDLLSRLGNPVRVVHSGAGVLEYEIELAPAGLGVG